MIKMVQKIQQRIKGFFSSEKRIYYLVKEGESYELRQKPVTGKQDLHELLDHYNDTQFTDKKSAEKRLRELNQK